MFRFIFLLLLLPLHALLASEVYYFAYGSNMNTQVLKEFLGKNAQFESLGAYRLDGYEFAYNRAPFSQGVTTTGGNIQPSKSACVYGVLWKLTDKEIATLDKLESAPKVYRRIEVTVQNARDPKDTRLAQVYVGNKEYIADYCNPRPQYVKWLVEGAREHQFPEKYIKTYLVK